MDSPTAALLDHERIITLAEEDARHTFITLPPADINARLAELYEPGADGAPIRLTRTQLWDMECRKAKDPSRYLGPVIKPGSATTYPSTRHGDGGRAQDGSEGEADADPQRYEDFVRVAQHRPWQAPDAWHTVIENVRLDHRRQVAWFVGTKQFNPPDAADPLAPPSKKHKITAGDVQPLFHVVHGVDGTEHDPVNTWSIVHLTDERDLSLVDQFTKIGQDPYLKGFVEVYIREVMGVDLKRK